MYQCSHINCTWSSDDHRALGGHKRSHVVYGAEGAALRGEELAAGGHEAAGDLGDEEEEGGEEEVVEEEEEEEEEDSEEEEESEEELEELDGGGSDGEDVDEAGDAGLAALAAKAAAPVQAAADADIEAANAGLRWLSLRQEYEKYQLEQLAKPNATRNAIFSAKVAEMGLSQANSHEVRGITLDMMRSCEDPHCTCSNHTAKIWGATRRATAEGRLVTADALGAVLFVEKTRTDAKLGKDAMGLQLPSILFSLRHFLERTARSVCHAAGSFLYLDGTTQFKDSGGCSEMQQTELVLQGAANAHAVWNASAAKPLLCERAAELGYSNVLLVPMGYSACEDATLGTTRTSVDLVQWRLSILAPHCMNHDHFVSVGGLLTKPNFSENVLPPKNDAWAAAAYAKSLAAGYGMDELLRWDAEGLLIVDRFPGLSLQPPEGERWLFILSPYLAGISGDLQGIYKSYALKGSGKAAACPFCLVPHNEFNCDACLHPERWRNDVAERVARLQVAFNSSKDVATQKRAAEELWTVHGIHAAFTASKRISSPHVSRDSARKGSTSRPNPFCAVRMSAETKLKM